MGICESSVCVCVQYLICTTLLTTSTLIITCNWSLLNAFVTCVAVCFLCRCLCSVFSVVIWVVFVGVVGVALF